jgi:hypothetical protein
LDPDHKSVDCFSPPLQFGIFPTIRQFRDRETDLIFLMPTEMSRDVVDGNPSNNAAPPNALGYQQIGKTIYS